MAMRINADALEAATKAAFESGPYKNERTWAKADKDLKKVCLEQASIILRTYEDEKARLLKEKKAKKV